MIFISSNAINFMTKNNQSLITTFGNDIYIIKGKTPDQVQDLIDAGGDMIRMPNGTRVNRKSIATIQSREDYTFQTDQKARHKKGQFLKNGEWHDQQGSLGIDSELYKITGEIDKKLLSPGKPITLKKNNE